MNKSEYLSLVEDAMQIAFEEKDYAKLKRLTAKLYKVSPELDRGFFYYNNALYYYSQAIYDKAINCYMLADKENNEWPSYQISLGIAKCYGQLGKDSLELEYLNKSIKRESYMPRKVVEYMYEKKMLPTKDTVLYILDRKDTARKERADWYWRHQQYDKAIADMDTIIMFRPSAENYFQKGLMYYKLGKYDQAVVAFDSAIHRPRRYMAKDKTKLYAYKASCLGKLGHYQEALQLYQRRIDGDCDSGLLYYLRGITYLDAGEPARTCQDWEKAIELYYWKNGLLDKYKEMCE